MHLEGKNVFLSGPMSGKEHNNIAAFAEAHAIVHELGATHVYNPAHSWLMTMLEDAREKTHEDWMLACVHELCRPAYMGENGPYYDLLVSLPGWGSSDGAAMERAVAEAIGVECRDLADILLELG